MPTYVCVFCYLDLAYDSFYGIKHFSKCGKDFELTTWEQSCGGANTFALVFVPIFSLCCVYLCIMFVTAS